MSPPVVVGDWVNESQAGGARVEKGGGLVSHSDGAEPVANGLGKDDADTTPGAAVGGPKGAG